MMDLEDRTKLKILFFFRVAYHMEYSIFCNLKFSKHLLMRNEAKPIQNINQPLKS